MSLDDQIPLNKLPLNDLLGFLEINPPRLPYNSLVGLPSKNTPIVTLNEFLLTSAATGFSMSLGAKLDPKHYAHLLLVYAIQSDQATAQQCAMTFNADNSPGNSHYKWAAGASITTADAAVFADLVETGAAWKTAGLLIIPNYLDSANGKSFISIFARLGSAFNGSIIGGGWSQTAAITQLDFKALSGNIKSGSRFSAYAFGVAS